MYHDLSQRINAFRTSLFSPISGASLVFFRIVFGLVLFWEVTRYFNHNWIHRYWIEPRFLFFYEGFEWVKPWAGNGMYVHFLLLGLLAAFITIGFLYRLSTVLFFLGFTYIFLLDKTNYLNHFYLISLLSGLFIFLPAHRRFALDAYLGLSKASNQVPMWSLFLLRAQLFIVYFFGGIAKINADWLQGIPIGTWLAKATDYPLIGQYFTESWAVLSFAYGGLLFDVFIVPLLWWKKTRPFAFLIALFFHLSNVYLFQIGIFPWFMIVATTLFLEPDWCSRLIPKLGLTLPLARWVPTFGSPRLVMTLLGAFLLWQTLMPLRHFLYPGNLSWTEEGHRFSWHMKLRSKSGNAKFIVHSPDTDEEWTIDPRRFLTKRQVQKMVGRPDMVLQFSHYLTRYFHHQGYEGVEVYAEVYASLNHRPRRLLIDPEVNLAEISASLWSADWILPLDEAPSYDEHVARKRVSIQKETRTEDEGVRFVDAVTE